VAVFDRAADGTLTQKPGTLGCISDSGAGPCVDGTALDGASSVTVSSDGRSVYVASQISRAVAVFDRAADGSLTQKPGTAACISETGAGPCADGAALDVATSVSVSPDGQSAYVASFDSDSVAVLDRAADGSLTQKPGTAGCISDTGAAPCVDGAALDAPRWVTVSPDGASVYAASVISGSVAVFDREPAPPTATPTPSPPPSAQPENLVAPEIRSIGAGVYSCDPGTWRNVAATAGFTYRWFRHRPPRLTPERLTTGQTYKPDASVYGDSVFCTVTVTGPDGPVTARSAAVFFSSAGLNTLPPAYGDVRVRGIDVFQTVQANAGAQMYGYRPDGPFAPGLCGGGTPTSWRLVRFGGGLTLCDLQSRSAQYVDYEGVTLDRYKLTTAIVYVDVAGATAADPDLAYDLELSATRGGRTSLGEPVVRRVKNPPRSDRPWVETFERDTTAAFDGNTHGIAITLPSAWTSAGGSVQLHARLRFPSSLALGTASYGTRECDDPGLCVDNDAFTLNDVPFTDHPQLLLSALELRQDTAGQKPLPAPGGVLAKARRLFPGGDRMVVSPYRAMLNISGVETLSATAVAGSSPQQFTCNGQTGTAVTTRGCRWDFVSSLILGWITQNPARPRTLRGGAALRYDVVFGVHDYADGGGGQEPGWTTGSIADVSSSEPRTVDTTPFFTATASSRPLTAGAHELGHVLTAMHASTCAPGGATAPFAEPWPEVAGVLGGEQGRLQGVKFTRTRSLRGVRTDVTADGPYTAADGGTLDRPLFDLMSYCAGSGDTATDDDVAWLSPRNWNRFSRELGELGLRVGFGARATAAAAAPASSAARASAVRERTAFAVGTAGSAGGKLMRVVSGDGQAAVPDPVPASPFRLRSLDPSGRVLLEAGVAVRPLSEAGDDDSGPFAGPVAPTAAAVELVHDGRVLDRLSRSRSPAVKLRSPGRGTRVGSKGELTVRWQASDPDGDALNATIDFSADNGRTWRTVYDGPSMGRASLPGSFLAGSKRARIRLGISDGFSQRRATSRPFVAQGTRPRVQILSPQTAALVRSGERTLLTGSAFDDLDRQLPGKALTWFAGKKRLGSGRQLRVRLPLGARRLALVARDRTGRKGTSRLPLRVEAPRLRIVDLDVPLKVSRKARTVTVQIKTSAAAVVNAARRRFRVGTKRTKLTIPLPARPAVGVLRIPFKLSPSSRAVQGKVKGTFSVART
jgi:DNA-binding beta-propeller fold protein YncE